MKSLMSILLLFFLVNIISLPTYGNSQGYTIELYIPQDLGSPIVPLVVENNEVSIIQSGIKIPLIETNNEELNSEVNLEGETDLEKKDRILDNIKKDFYLTIIYSSYPKKKLYVYNHGKKVNEVKLRGLDFNFYDFLHELKSKFENDELPYFKAIGRSLSDKRIKRSYKKNYEKIKQEIEKTIRYQVTTRTWDGGGADANWNTALNWSADTVPAATDNVVFDGTSTMACTINVNTASLTNFSINAGYTGTITQNTGITITATGNFSQAAGTLTGGNSTIDIDGTFTVSGGTFTSTTGNLQIGDDFTHSGGTFTHNSGTVILDGTAQATLDTSASGTTFSALTVNKTSSTNPDVTLSTGDTFVVAGTFTWTDGDIDGSGVLDTRAGVSVAATADGHTTTVSDLQLTGSATVTCTLNAGGALSQLTINNANATCSTAGTGTVTFQDDLIQTTGTFTGGAQTVDVDGGVTISAGTFTAPSLTLTVAGGWTHTAGGTFTHNSGTVTFDGGAATIDVSTNETFSALTINPATVGSIKTVAASDTLIAAGTLTLTEGLVNQATVPSGGTLAARAGVSQASTFDGGTGTLVVDGTGAQTLTFNSTGTLPAVTVNKSSGTATLAGSANLGTSTLTVTAGTLDQGASFNITSGAVSIASGATLSNTGTGDITLAGNLSNAGTLTLDGNGGGAGSADDIAIRSSANGTQRTWSGAGTFTVRDVDLQDQAVDSTSPGKVYANSCTNTGNNSRFSFNVPPVPSISMATLNGGPLSTTLTTFYPSYNESLVITFTSTDSDSTLDTVTLSTPTVPGAGTFSAGTAANPGTGTYAFTPSASNQGATYTFTVRATDDNTATSTADLQITIVGPTSGPPSTIMGQPVTTEPPSIKPSETTKPTPPTPTTQPFPIPKPTPAQPTTKPSPIPKPTPEVQPPAPTPEPSITPQPSSGGDIKPKPPKKPKGGGKGNKGNKGGKKPKPPKGPKGAVA